LDNVGRKLSTGRVPGDVSPSRLSGGRPQSLPWETIQVPSDDESQVRGLAD
jgi:D-tyrosyl-tRNA(Tyr) deacylase